MAIKYGKKKQRQTNVLYTIVTAILICTIFLSLISYFYNEAENEANEMLHIQTKQIKDDLILQLKSDRENLDTMANFAAKLHVDGESYNILFDSFKPIGLFSAVGILNPDNTFVTKIGSIDLSDKISYEDEVLRGKYISGRIPDLTRNGKEIVRSAVPIVSDGKTVGILYGVIQLETISKKYNQMAQELDAQLFVYDRETGKFIIDTINENPSELSQLKTRKYNDDYSYEKLINSDKGYTSFKSIKTGEDLYIHYSTLEDFEWGIMLARYETQVFEKTHNISKTLFTTFALMMFVIVIYSLIIFKNERRRSVASLYVSSIRKLLLEINQHENNVFEALKHICEISFSRSSFFIDTDGEDFNYIRPDFKNSLLFGKDKNYFISELFQYARTLHSINHSTLGFMCIKPNKHLRKTNKALYEFLKEHKINEISLAAINGKDNQTSILGVTNAKKNRIIRMLLEDVAVCFSIAIFNKNHLNRTETAATTDSLTGALNRVSYKKDILVFDEEKPTEFSCIYIDVNELHLMNNKYGHAAGDEMLK